jgi:hypothetical protein
MNDAYSPNKKDIEEILSEIFQEKLAGMFDEIKSVHAAAPALMTVRQLAAYLQVTEQSIFNWIKREANSLPVTYVGSDPRFIIDDIRRWMKEEAARRLDKNSEKRNRRKNNKPSQR